MLLRLKLGRQTRRGNTCVPLLSQDRETLHKIICGFLSGFQPAKVPLKQTHTHTTQPCPVLGFSRCVWSARVVLR